MKGRVTMSVTRLQVADVSTQGFGSPHADQTLRFFCDI